MCPCHRAVAPTPPECPAASADVRRSMLPSPSGCRLGLRGYSISGPPLRSLALRPGDSPTIPRMAVSMGFRTFGFPPACHPSYGASALTPAGLTPAEHISLTWTHNRTCTFRRIRLSSRFNPGGSLSTAIKVPRFAPGGCQHISLFRALDLEAVLHPRLMASVVSASRMSRTSRADHPPTWPASPWGRLSRPPTTTGPPSP